MKRVKGLKYGLICAVAVLFGGMTMAVSNPDFALGRNLQILFNMFRELNLLYVDQIDPDKMALDAAEGMVSELDPYTELIPESEMSTFEIMTTGKYGGIGAMIRKKGDYVMIAQPYKDSPADKAGLMIGDVILEIDAESIKGYDSQQVSSMLKGTPGTSLRLKVQRLLSDSTQEVAFKRERIVISGVPYYGVIGDSIGYILHKEFTEDCSNDLRAAFMALRKQGIKGLIIDLRGNGGGILQEAVKILSMFVPKGTEVVAMRGRMKEMDATFVTQNDPVDTTLPVAVLINSTTASAAEIVSGAFQDLDRGVLIGQRSFGKGLVQSTRPLGFNAYLKLTTAKYYIPSGRCIQAIDYSHRAEDGSVGMVPDLLVKEYATRAGRKVYDGGGVMPDIKLAPTYFGRFTFALYNQGYVEDFANRYFKEHRQGINPDTFRLQESDYEDFVRFMADKEVNFESETRQTIDQLRKKAQRDKYLERIEGELKAIEAKIQDDKDAELQAFRKEISQMIEDEIILRYAYQQGVARHNAVNDPEIRQAVELLRDSARYHRIVTTQNTERK